MNNVQVQQLPGQTSSSIFHCNVRSIRKNLYLLVAQLSEHAQPFHIIAITETWLQKGEEVVITDYRFTSQPRESRNRGGGVALFVHKSFSFTSLPSISCSCSFMEALFVKLEFPLIVSVIYRPPNSSLPAFLAKLEMIFMTVSETYTDPVVVVGDFNLDTSYDAHKDY